MKTLTEIAEYIPQDMSNQEAAVLCVMLICITAIICTVFK